MMEEWAECKLENQDNFPLFVRRDDSMLADICFQGEESESIRKKNVSNRTMGW